MRGMKGIFIKPAADPRKAIVVLPSGKQVTHLGADIAPLFQYLAGCPLPTHWACRSFDRAIARRELFSSFVNPLPIDPAFFP